MKALTTSVWTALVALQSFTSFGNPTVESVPRAHPGWMERHESTAKALQESDPRLLFIGDSITHFWEATGKDVWQEEFARYRAVNLGIAGDRTQHVLWRIDEALVGVSPELVIVQIGTNNITADRQADFPGDAPEDIAAGILEVVRSVRERLPDANILLLGLFPRADIAPESADLVNEVNALLAQAELDDDTTFKDIGPALLEADGNLSKTVMWDLLHLTEEGYRRWGEAIRDEVRATLDE